MNTNNLTVCWVDARAFNRRGRYLVRAVREILSLRSELNITRRALMASDARVRDLQEQMRTVDALRRTVDILTRQREELREAVRVLDDYRDPWR